MVVKGVVVTGQFAGQIFEVNDTRLRLQEYTEHIEVYNDYVTDVVQISPIKTIAYRIFLDYFWIPVGMEEDEALREIAYNYRPIKKYLKDFNKL